MIAEPEFLGITGTEFTSVVDVIPIDDPYVADYTPPDHLRDFDEERRVTRACLALSDEVVVQNDELVIPEDVDPEDRDRIVELGPYLRWAARLPANTWMRGGPANFPEAVLRKANFGHVRHRQDDLDVHEGGQA